MKDFFLCNGLLFRISSTWPGSNFLYSPYVLSMRNFISKSTCFKILKWSNGLPSSPLMIDPCLIWLHSTSISTPTRRCDITASPYLHLLFKSSLHFKFCLPHLFPLSSHQIFSPFYTNKPQPNLLRFFIISSQFELCLSSILQVGSASLCANTITSTPLSGQSGINFNFLFCFVSSHFVPSALRLL